MLRTSETLKNCSKTFGLLPVGVALINLGVICSPVFAVTFQETTRGVLEFRDESDQIVGTGTFNYSRTPLEGIFVVGVLDQPGFPESVFGFFNDASAIPSNWIIDQQVEISESEDLRLANISLNFNGSPQTYNFGSFPAENYFFTPPDSSVLPFGDVFSTIRIIPNRSPFLTLQTFDNWFYQEPFLGLQLLSIDEDGTFYFFDSDISSEINLTGTWTATAVIPEPFTILGASTALAFGTFFKRKLFTRRYRSNKDS